MHEGKRGSHAWIHAAPLSSGKDKRDCATEEEKPDITLDFERSSLRYQIREMIVANADAKIFFDVVHREDSLELRLASKQIRRNYVLGNVTRREWHCERPIIFTFGSLSR